MRVLVPENEAAEAVDLEPLYAPPDGRQLRVGFVQSLDGAVAVDGRSRGLGSSADLQVFRALRAVSDALLVGAGTARAEQYGPVRLTAAGAAWRQATGRPPDVPLLIVSRSGGAGLDANRLPPSTLVLTTSAATRAGRSPFEQIACGDTEVDLARALDVVAERGYRRLVCEGGPTLFSALLAADLVDELCLTLSPLLVGGAPTLLADPPVAPRPLQLVGLIGEGDVLLSRWAVHRG